MAISTVVLLGLILFHSHQWPALGDYGEWTYHGVLFRQVLRGDPVVGYVLKHYPVPNSLTTWGLGVLMLVVPWQIAAKLWLLVVVAFGTGAAVQLRRVVDPASQWPVLIAIGGGFLGVAFWAGFTNFLLGCGCAMLVAASLLRGRGGHWRSGALLLLAFFSHMIPFAFALLLLLLYIWQTHAWRLLLQAVPGCLLSLWYFAGRALHGNADGQAGMVASVRYLAPEFFLFKLNTYMKCWGFINPAYGEHDSVLLQRLGTGPFVALFVTNAALALAMGILITARARRSFQERLSDRFAWAAIAVFFAAGCVVPGAMGGVSDPGGRMMQLAMWCGALLVSTNGRGRRAMAAAALCAVLLLSADVYLLQTVAMRSPAVGELHGPLPAAVRQFGHVYYADRYEDYSAIEAGLMNREIYPTALFLKVRDGSRDR